ncbi:MAG: epimerase [Nocardioidaceae bacterium]|nr:epimerase [Nocardioidaceae bacterium]
MVDAESGALANLEENIMKDRHVIVGAGPVGRHVAQLLALRGSEVTVVTRSGTDTGIDGVKHQKADASDPAALTAAAEGASVLYNCANPPDYTTWTDVWPPLAASLLTSAERTGAVLAIAGNLYPYGKVSSPMVEGDPDSSTETKGKLRATMWADALSAHHAGRVRAFEVRASDYVGPKIGANSHGTRNIEAAKKGKTAWVIGSPDQPHSWTDVLDVARILIAAAEDESAHGRIWHAPTNVPRTQTEALNDIMAVGGFASVKVRPMPKAFLKAAGLVMPVVRELNHMSYQFEAPYIVNSTAATAKFGLEPTPWDEVCRRSLDQ